MKDSIEYTREYLEALADLDREFKEAPAMTAFQELLLEINFGIPFRKDWDGTRLQ